MNLLLRQLQRKHGGTIWGLEDVVTWGRSVAKAWRIAPGDNVMRGLGDDFKPCANYFGKSRDCDTKVINARHKRLID